MPRYEVLLISKDLPTIRIIKSYFESKMFKFNIVSSCSQALEELQSQTPMLILLDRILPKENRIEFLKVIKNNKKLGKISIKTFTKNEYKIQRTNKRKNKNLIFKGDELNQKDKKKDPHLDLLQLQRWINFHSTSPPVPSKFTEFKINQFITLKLKHGKTFIYVNGKKFLQCIRLALNIQKSNVQMYDVINSIDEAADLYAKHIFQNKIIPEEYAITSQGHDITAEQEFWGHCSNIQAWVEHDYDTRLLKSNISFPLLRELTQAGDPMARKVFKEEIALRIEDGYPSVVQYLINEGYLRYLTPSEIETILETTKLIETKNRNLLNSIKKALRNHPKQADLQEREVIEEIINEINEKIAKDGYKVIVIGDPEVGKSELLTKFTTNLSAKNLKQSIGVQFFKKQVELKDHNATVNLNFWDLATQQFTVLHSLYLKRADGILLVFDLSRESTFSNLNEWFSICPVGVPRILIGNKVNPENERKTTLPMAERLSEEFNASYFETSTAVGENINLIFHKIAELIYKTKELEAKELKNQRYLGEIVFKLHEDNLNEVKKTRKIKPIETRKAQKLKPFVPAKYIPPDFSDNDFALDLKQIEFMTKQLTCPMCASTRIKRVRRRGIRAVLYPIPPIEYKYVCRKCGYEV